MNITLRQLRAFIAVAHERSFTSGAEKVSISQSALTSAVQKLEDQLGLKLFDRTTRQVTLTTSGRELLIVAERLLADVDSSLEYVRTAADRTRGSVAVAAAASFLQCVVCPALGSLAAAYPGISVRLFERTTDDALNDVMSGAVDFAITTLTEHSTAYRQLTLLEDTFGIMCAPTNPHSAKSVLRWQDLPPADYVGLHPSNGIRQLIDLHPGIPAKLKRSGYEVGNTSLLTPVLQAGFGYGILPALAAQPFLQQGMRFIPLREPRVSRTLYLVKRKERSLSSASTALLEYIEQAGRRTADGIDIHWSLSQESLDDFLQPT